MMPGFKIKLLSLLLSQRQRFRVSGFIVFMHLILKELSGYFLFIQTFFRVWFSSSYRWKHTIQKCENLIARQIKKQKESSCPSSAVAWNVAHIMVLYYIIYSGAFTGVRTLLSLFFFMIFIITLISDINLSGHMAQSQRWVSLRCPFLCPFLACPSGVRISF